MAEVRKSNIRLIPKAAQEQLRGALASINSSEGSEGDVSPENQPGPTSTVAYNSAASEELFETANLEEPLAQGLALLPVDRVRFSPLQTRGNFSKDSLEELASSILSKGVIQPILVRPAKTIEGGDTVYEIVAGERRLRAARLAGLADIPAIVQDLEDQSALELAIIENAQREDLNPVEEALALKHLSQEFKLSQKDIASRIGKSRSAVANSLRLLQLQPEVLELLRSGELATGHGKVLLSVDDPKEQLRLAAKAASMQMSVRALEDAVSRQVELEEESEEDEALRNSLLRIEARVAKLLEMEEVKLTLDAKGQKRLSLTFPSEASWKRFVAKLRD